MPKPRSEGGLRLPKARVICWKLRPWGLDQRRRPAAPGDTIWVREVSPFSLLNSLVPTSTPHWPNPTEASWPAGLWGSAPCQQLRKEEEQDGKQVMTNKNANSPSERGSRFPSQSETSGSVNQVARWQWKKGTVNIGPLPSCVRSGLTQPFSSSPAGQLQERRPWSAHSSPSQRAAYPAHLGSLSQHSLLRCSSAPSQNPERIYPSQSSSDVCCPAVLFIFHFLTLWQFTYFSRAH